MINVGIYKKALEEAENSLYYPYRIGAVIFKHNRILSSGKNQLRYSSRLKPEFKDFPNVLHAEQDAIINAASNIRGASIFVIRTNQNGKISMARPCDMCYRLLQHVGIKYMYYTDRDGTIKKEKVTKL